MPLRLGFAIAQPHLLSGLFKIKDSYNIDAIATLVGIAAMQDQDYKNDCAEKVKRSRKTLASDLRQLGWKVWDSQTNFLLTQPSSSAEKIYFALKERGILVRYFNQPKLEDKLRITIGTDEQNQTLIKALLDL
jgi:histidinol-phosphate aminotransferase